ncbi:hypothetical protein GH833_25955, partial [Bacillus thuringiensis]|nr:hypothetical protein [Bacillus thuringiensis]MRD15204.1 hypothetical protein [Bacillus thuringiensis]
MSKLFTKILIGKKAVIGAISAVVVGGGVTTGVPPAFRKKTTLRKSELKNQKIYHY